ncbi:MAG: porin [Polaromonas sp.]|jgi:predicted porin|nr:porin [Polaromonas sp.]
MKKTLIAFAALSAIAGVAQAQSTVTLYGLLDANLGSYKGNFVSGTAPAQTIQSARQTRIDSGGLNGSRWGIRIREDLGGGLAAIGNLESGINLDTGSSAQGGLLFGRRANVGLTGGFGTVTIGRNSSSYDDVSADHAMMGATIFDPSNTNNGLAVSQAAAIGSVAGAQPFLNRNTTWVGFNTRFNNSVKYISPNFGGFTGSLMYALGEDKTTGAGGVDASRTISANLKFANGPLVISGGYQSEQAGGSLGGANLNTPAGAEPALENALLNVSYDLGVARIGAGFNRAKYKDVAAPAILGGGTFAAQKEFSLSAAVPLGAATISATVARSKGDTLGKSTGAGIQALYSLSKRTTLYAGALSTKQYDRLARAVVTAAPGSNVGRVTTYAAGVRHTF